MGRGLGYKGEEENECLGARGKIKGDHEILQFLKINFYSVLYKMVQLTHDEQEQNSGKDLKPCVFIILTVNAHLKGSTKRQLD